MSLNYVPFSCRYIKALDPDNWLTIDEKTGAIRMNKAPDRESKYLVNGTYYAQVYSITQGRFQGKCFNLCCFMRMWICQLF